MTNCESIMFLVTFISAFIITFGFINLALFPLLYWLDRITHKKRNLQDE